MNSVAILNDPLVPQLGWALIHFLWQGIIVASVTGILLTATRRRSASLRYIISIAALCAMVLCPLVTLGVLWPVAVSAVAFDVEPIGTEEHVVEVVHEAAGTAPAESPVVADETLSTPAVAPPTVSGSSSVSLTDRVTNLSPWIVCLWLVGVILLSIRLLASWIHVQRIARTCLEPVDARLQDLFDSLCDQLRIRRSVRLVRSSRVSVPSTIGWLRPLVLLPVGAITGLTTEQLTAVLAHELAHVRRHDYLINLLQGVAETLLFYHPAVWWMSRRIREERENCCDDAAISVTGRPAEYARALTRLAEASQAPRLATAATGSELSSRIRRLLGTQARGRRGPTRGAALVALSVIFCLGIVIGATDGQAWEPGENTGDQELVGTEFVFAQHVTLRAGEIVSFERALNEIGVLHENADRFAVYFTSGLPHEQQTKLGDYLTERRIGWTYAGPLIGPRFDRIRTAADLTPRAEDRLSGKLISADGTAVSGARVLVVPRAAVDAPHRLMLSDGHVNRPGLYESTRTDAGGSFTVHPQSKSWVLVALHESGIGWQTPEQVRRQEPVRLRKWARLGGKLIVAPRRSERLVLEVTPAPGVVLSVQARPDASGRFRITHLPPGRVTPQRTVDNATFAEDLIEIDPGGARALFFPGMPGTNQADGAAESLGPAMDVEFRQWTPGAFANAQKRWRPILLSVGSEPAPDWQRGFVNRKATAQLLAEHKYAKLQIDPQSPAGRKFLAETFGENAEPPQLIVFSRNRFLTPVVWHEAPGSPGEFLAAVREAAARPVGVSVPIIVAKHVLLLEGRVVTLAEVESRIRDLARTAEVHPEINSTNSALRDGREQSVKNAIYELKKELNFYGFSIGSLSPRAGERYDKIRTDDDLRPDGPAVAATIVTPQGRAPQGPVQILILPENQDASVYVNGVRVRNPLEEQLYYSGTAGRFTIPVPDDHVVLFLHESGFTARTTASLKPGSIVDLEAWAGVTGHIDTLTTPQLLNLTTSVARTKVRFHDYEIAVDQSGRFIRRVPPGSVLIQRSLQIDDSTRHSFPVQVVRLRPGESHRIDIGNAPTDVMEKVQAARERNSALMQRRLEEARKAEAAMNASRLRGRVIWTGKQPTLPPLFRKGQPIRDPAVFGGSSLPDEGLVINQQTRGVANVFIYLRKAPEGWAAPENEKFEPATFGLVDRNFKPRSLVLRTRQPIQLINEQKVATNLHCYSIRSDAYNMLLPANSRTQMGGYKTRELMPIQIRSDIHVWMQAWHLPLDHPFGMATDATGRFMIEDLPPGEHTFKVWHEKIGYLPDLKVKIDKNSGRGGRLHTIRLSNEIFADVLEKRLDKTKARLGDAHPRVRELKEQIARFRAAAAPAKDPPN